MQSSFLKRIGAVFIGVIIIGGAFILGTRYGAMRTLALDNIAPEVTNKNSGEPANVDFSLFWKAWQVLQDKYVPTTSAPVDDQKKVYGAIQGLASSLGDPYTVFFPPQESQSFQSQINGNFDGIGIEVGVKDGILTVIAPIKDSPAAKAGIKAGDKILKIEATSTENLSIDDAVALMRGPRGTSVKLTLLGDKDKQPREVTVMRDVIMIPTLDTKKLSNGIFQISLYSFDANSAVLFRNALLEFIKSGDTKLVLDLRGNPGGYLDAAVDMASWFMPGDKVVVKEDSGGHSEDVTYYSKGYDVFDPVKNKNFKMVVLVDGGSASAAEILAGALEQNGVATLVGTKTFGKGSVQEVVNLTPDTSLKVTIARWLTPNGTSISKQGLTPDVVVPVTDQDIQNQTDPQLAKAVELLSK